MPTGGLRRGTQLQDLMARSFFAMRWGLLAIGVLLPPVLLVGAHLQHPGHRAPLSISGYYHTGMRNVFVGAVVTIGVLMLLYRAFNVIENVLLNVAGIAAIGVALFPVAPDAGATDGATSGFWIHDWFATVTFAAIGIVAAFFGPDTVYLLPARLQPRYRRIYRTLGVAMFIVPAVTYLLSRAGLGSLFWIETVGLWIFAGYWLTKTVEYRTTAAEREAIRGTLPAPPPR